MNLEYRNVALLTCARRGWDDPGQPVPAGLRAPRRQGV